MTKGLPHTVAGGAVLALALGGIALATDCRWEFDRPEQAREWTLSGIEDGGVAEGAWRLTATAGNPMLFSPRMDIDAANQPVVTFRMRLGAGLRSNGCLLFTSDTQTTWDDRTIVTFPCQTDGEFHTYEVRMSANPLWTGRVRQLRLQPLYAQWPLPDDQRRVALDYVRVPDLAGGADGQTGAELLRNGGLEELDQAGTPTAWSRFVDAPLPIDAGDLKLSGDPGNSVVSAEAHDGQRAAAVSIPADRQEIGGWQTRVEIQPNRLYRLSFWARRQGTDYALVTLNEFKAEGTRTAHHECVLKSDQWELYTKDFMSHAESTGLQVGAIVWKQSGCQAWFDDFSLTEPGLGGLTAGPVPADTTPFSVLTGEVVTPHIAWAKPWAAGPVRLLVVPPCRDVVELAQRLSLDFTTWRPFEESDGGAGQAVMNDLYYGPRDRGLVASYRELAAKVAAGQEVILIGQQRWGKTFCWEGLPASLKGAILERARGGTGLIYVRPGDQARAELSAAADRELPLPPSLSVGVPYDGLTVLDRDVKGTDWLKCYAVGKGRLALVDYQSESFGCFESEKSFRRGSSCPFTPDVTYDARASPAEYEYHLSLLAKLVLWARAKEGAISLARIAVVDGRCVAEVANAGAAVRATTEVVVRDRDGKVEAELRGETTIEAGTSALSQPLGEPLKAGPHFADVWLRVDGQVVAWGSTCFATRSAANIAGLEVDKPFYRKGDAVAGRLVLDGEAPADAEVHVQLTDSLGRLLWDQTLPVAGRKELGFSLSPVGAETSLHRLRAGLLLSGRAVSEKGLDVILRREPVVDDFVFSFWAPLQNNELSSRYMLADFFRKGFTEAYIGYMYAIPAAQLEPALRTTLGAGFDLSFFAFSLAAWDAGSDPTATVSPRCLTQEAFRQRLTNTLRQHAAVGRNYPVFGYSLGDEAGISGHAQDYCFSPTCLAYTRSYLQSAYGALEALNAEWDTTFATWEAVTPMTRPQARQHGNIAPWVDHRLAMEAMFADLVRDAGGVLRSEDPSARVGTEGITGGGMYGNNGEDSFVGYDFGRIFPVGQHWGVYFQHYPQIEYLRSFAPAESIRFTYPQPFEDYPAGYYRDTWTNEAVNRFVPWYDLFNGMNGTMYWGSLGTDWYAFYSSDFRPTPWSRQIAETIQEIRGGVGKLLLKCGRDNSGVAIHYSPASFHVQTILGGRERVESPKAFCRLLEDLALQYDFISAQQMAAGKLSEYRVLVLPYSHAIGTDEARQIRAFAGQGGAVIADGTPGTMDGHGRKVDEPMLSGVPVHVCASAIWKYNEAAVRNGAAGRACREEVAKALAAAGVEPRFGIAAKDGSDLLGCELVDFTDGPAEYLGVLQGREYIKAAGDPHDPVPVTVRLPRRAHVYSVRDHQYLGEQDRIETGIAPAVAKLYALLPCRLDGLALTGLGEARARGETVRFEVAGQTAPATDLPQVVRVDVTAPDGSPCTAYRRTLYGAKGKVTGGFTFALNDATGTWRLTATDVATGVTAEATFFVR